MSSVDDLTTWGTDDDVFVVSEWNADSPTSTDVVLVSRRGELEMDLVRPETGTRFVVRHELEAPDNATEELQRVARDLDMTAPALVTCRFDEARRTYDLEALIFEDGFSRHALNAAVADIVGCRERLDVRLEMIERTAELDQEMQRLLDEDEEALWARLDAASESATGPDTGVDREAASPTAPTPAAAPLPPLPPPPSGASLQRCYVTQVVDLHGADIELVVGQLQVGAWYDVLDEQSGWLRVASPDRRVDGWVDRRRVNVA